MLGDIAAQFFAAGVQLVGWLAAQPIASMWSVPALLLAVAPAWYFRFGYRIPQVLFHTPKIQSQAIVYTLLVLELCLSPYRSKLYTFSPFFAFIFGPFASFCIFVTGLAMVTSLRRLANGCFDTLLVIDNISSFSFICSSSFSLTSLMLFTLSTSRSALFLGEDAWYTSVDLYQKMKRSREVVVAIDSLRKSPFYVTSTANVDELGREFDSDRLHQKFNQAWSQYKEVASRYRLFWATIITLRWDFALVCAARSVLAIATLSQARALSYLLAVMQEKSSLFIQKLSALFVIIVVFLCYVAIRQITTRLMNRLVTFVRGIILGQIQTKTLRLSLLNAHERAGATLMDSAMDDLVNQVPDLLEIAASALELGLAISNLSGHLGVVTFVVVIPALGAIIPSSRLSEQLGETQKAWGTTIRSRVSATAQILAQTKTIKMIGLDSTICRYLKKLYEAEMGGMKGSRYTHSVYMLIVAVMDKFTTVLLLTCAVFYSRLENGLVPSILFPSLLLIAIITERLNIISRAQQRYVNALNTYNRLQDYLAMEEVNKTNADDRLIHVAICHSMFNDSPVSMTPELFTQIQKKLPNDDPLQLLNVSVILPGDNTPLFRQVSVSVPRKKLTVVVGTNGSGKSKFLQLLLGEVALTSGQLYLQPGTTVVYCGQAVWLRDESIKNNIVGDQTFNQERYLDALSRCQLLGDLDTLPDRDDTMATANIISLSFQYKIALARTAYSTASLVLVDDILSWLDVTTASRIFTSLFGPDGLFTIQRRTVVLATCFQKHMADAELAVFLVGNGRVITREAGAQFSLPDGLSSMIGRLADSRTANAAKGRLSSNNETVVDTPTRRNIDAEDALQDDHEYRETAFWVLLRLVPSRLFISFLLRMAIAASLYRGPEILTSFWFANNPEGKFPLLILIAVSVVSVATNISAYRFSFEKLLAEFLTALYDTVVVTNMNAKTSYLDTSNQSTIIDQLNQHMTSTSKGLSLVFVQVTYFILVILAEVTIVGFMSELTTPLLLCLAALVLFILIAHIPRCSQLQQMREQTESSRLVHYTKAANGIEHIRVSGQVETTVSRGLSLLDKSQLPFFHILDTKRWMNCIVDTVMSAIVIIIAVVGVLPGTVDATIAGLAVFVVVSIGYKIDLAVTYLTTFKTMLPSLVYLLDFIAETPVEPPEAQQVQNLAWPADSSVTLRDVTAISGAHATTETTISGISLSIRPGEKVGVVDFSGSGKSLLMSTIINLIDFTGSVKVGNIEVMAIPRRQLRSRVTTLTSQWLQLPGTIEQNLMPWRLVEDHADHLNIEKVRKVLIDTDLWGYVQRAGGLSTPMEETDLSSGQRTQFSMTRLILHHLYHQNKVVMMDDPMATLNAKGREKVSWLVSKYFGNSTVLTLCKDSHAVGVVDTVYWLEDAHENYAEASES